MFWSRIQEVGKALELSYFQPRHVVADGTKVMRKLCSEAQNGWSFAGITCVFVRIISAAATGNAGLAAVVRTALGHVNDVASRSCGACGAFAAFPPGFLAVRGCEHLAHRAARDSSRSDGRNRFLLRLLFSLSSGEDFRVTKTK
jgi:hypothetical protein